MKPLLMCRANCLKHQFTFLHKLRSSKRGYMLCPLVLAKSPGGLLPHAPKGFQKCRCGNYFPLHLSKPNLCGWTSQQGKTLWPKPLYKIEWPLTCYCWKGMESNFKPLCCSQQQASLFVTWNASPLPCKHFRSNSISSNLHLKGLSAEFKAGRSTVP